MAPSTSNIFGELRYEQRLIAFFDTLGWKNQIEHAGDDPYRIARLASLPRQFSRAVTGLAERVAGARITSFSDNVVASIPYKTEYLFPTLDALARIQFGAAAQGFLIRGAVTVGQLYHDEEIVFGPGLNRAYELESNKVSGAIYPRIILDPATSLKDFFPYAADFLSSDTHHTFINPFNYSFLKRAFATDPISPDMRTQFEKSMRISVPELSSMDPMQCLVFVYLKILEDMENTTGKVREKYVWLVEQMKSSIVEIEALQSKGS